ncbi:hypothetical protein ARMGADRAFT_692017 [Armillaria gallica]|uniref:Uncharacterized protein n=1 Tax=Armillaria gallica TaxID=47427 RepID=A0A2H3DM73_ARMGA|nr:hypothetical protein ARMGADRAFT_692017 [Armillaria gallica]
MSYLRSACAYYYRTLKIYSYNYYQAYHTRNRSRLHRVWTLSEVVLCISFRYAEAGDKRSFFRRIWHHLKAAPSCIRPIPRLCVPRSRLSLLTGTKPSHSIGFASSRGHIRLMHIRIPSISRMSPPHSCINHKRPLFSRCRSSFRGWKCLGKMLKARYYSELYLNPLPTSGSSLIHGQL